MKCINPNCGGEWTPPHGKSVIACPFCGESTAIEKKKFHSFDNVEDTLIYIKEQYGADTLLSGKVYTYFADLTRNQLRDETDLIKQLCEKGALDCLKDAIGKYDSEHEAAINRALFKLPKYLQVSPVVEEMICNFAAALGWKIKRQSVVSQFKQSSAVTRGELSANTSKIVVPPVGSVKNLAGIDWRVLAVENNKALLISEKILEKRPYNIDWKDITWENCTLRKYLNGEFLNKLGEIEPAIAETRNSNPDNPWYGTAGGNATTDKVFLLSLDELAVYFGNSGDLTNKRRKDYNGNAKSNGGCVHDQYNSARIASYGSEESSWWWLQSPGGQCNYTAAVSGDGVIGVGGNIVDRDSGGVRPALWLNL